MYRRYAFATSILLLTLGIGTTFADEGKRFEEEQAVRLLYGDVIFRSEKLKSYFQSQDYGYVSVAFAASYLEQGQHKHVVVVRVTPKPAEEYFCHACAPVIGGGVFKWSGNGWIVESKTELIGWGNSFGETFSLVEVGPDRHGILDVINDAHQGYEDKSIRLIVPYRNALLMALDVGFGEKPGPGACEDAMLPEQYAHIRFLQSKTEFFDVVSKLRFNDGSCEKFSVRNQTVRYRFVGGMYKRSSQ